MPGNSNGRTERTIMQALEQIKGGRTNQRGQNKSKGSGLFVLMIEVG
jgi:hypothetical protein